jgi:flagellar hook-basal body complex protein FliE
MVLNVSDALSAYKNGSGLSVGGTAPDNGLGSVSGGESFSDALGKFASDAVGSMREGEKAAADGATGKVGIASVVTAISNAELMLQTVVTIRDKVIAAYQDISKTQV